MPNGTAIFLLYYPQMLNYAETHFRLPVSRLYKKEPVILIDAPFQVLPGLNCPFWLVVRNASRFPVYIQEIYGAWKNTNGDCIEFKLPIEKKFDQKFHFEYLNITLPLQPLHGLWQMQIFIKYDTGRNQKICERWNYPFLEPKPMIINFLKEAPPKPEGWLAGETHCHSSYTSDSVEFGASLPVLQKAAATVGLDFVCVTDHSYDLLNEKKFQKMRAEVAKLNVRALHATPLPMLIAGEEVSCGNAKNENVHLLVFGNEKYIEGHGDGGRRWWNTKPDLSIADVCRGVVPFAAHPKLPMLLAEKLLLKRGHWSFKDLTETNICGIEFWNGFRGKDFYEGRALWIKCLLQGHKLLPLGGNDAHGDLNSYTAVKKPLWSLKQNQEHVFGQVRTVIPNTGKTPFSEIPETLYLTDGPALWFEDGRLYAKTTEDYGKFANITMFLGKNNAEKKQELQVNDSLNFNCEIPQNDCLYVRAECETIYGKFAMTAALWR